MLVASEFNVILVLLVITSSVEDDSHAADEGYVLVENDIKMTVEEFDVFMGQEDTDADQVDFSHTKFANPGEEKRHRTKRAVTAFKDRLWPNATIPYLIGKRVTGFVVDNILKAMAHWEKHSCVRFVNRTDDEYVDYISFDPGLCGCCSFVGRKGGKQEVTLSAHCAAYGVVIHELGHVIGFWHEHSRPDRDKYIKIIEKNILPEKMDNFDIKSAGEIDSLGQPYDYYSIMHYRRKTFSKFGKITMEPQEEGVQIGQRDALSAGDKVQANLLYNCPKPDCGEEIMRNSGNFSSPNYPVKYFRDHSCTWIFHVHSGEELSIDFQDVAIESSANCSYDYLEIREGTDVTGSLIGRLCGEGKAGVLKSTTSIWIKFVSDKSVANRGFMANFWKRGEVLEGLSGSGESLPPEYSSSGSDDYIMQSESLIPEPRTEYLAKCTNYISARKGEIRNPLMFAQYNGNAMDCSWTIDGGASAVRVHLAIRVPSSLRGDAAERCIGDIYQQVTDTVRRHKSLLKEVPDRHGENDAGRKSDEASGADQEDAEDEEDEEFYDVEKFVPVRYNCQQTKQLTLNTRKAMIQWSSDINQPFALDYVIDYDECSMGTAACEHICHNTLQGYTCSCRTGFQPHHAFLHKCVSKKVQFADKCNSTLTAERGRLRGGTEPIEDCELTIRAPSGLRLLLTFVKFNVPSEVINGSCTENFVEIYTGSHKSSRGQYCGIQGPQSVSTSSGLIVVHAHTDTGAVLTMPYFTAIYTTFKNEQDAECSFRMRASGHINSPSYPRLYPPHANCVWRVSAPKSSVIRIHIDDIDIENTEECDFDFVELREGRHRTSPLLARYCGTQAPPDVHSAGRHLWVNFMTDKDGSGRGFRATFSSVHVAMITKNTASQNETEISVEESEESLDGTTERVAVDLVTMTTTAP